MNTTITTPIKWNYTSKPAEVKGFLQKTPVLPEHQSGNANAAGILQQTEEVQPLREARVAGTASREQSGAIDEGTAPEQSRIENHIATNPSGFTIPIFNGNAELSGHVRCILPHASIISYEQKTGVVGTEVRDALLSKRPAKAVFVVPTVSDYIALSEQFSGHGRQNDYYCFTICTGFAEGENMHALAPLLRPALEGKTVCIIHNNTEREICRAQSRAAYFARFSEVHLAPLPNKQDGSPIQDLQEFMALYGTLASFWEPFDTVVTGNAEASPNTTLQLYASVPRCVAQLNNTSFSTEPTVISDINAWDFLCYDHTTIQFRGGHSHGDNFECAMAIPFDIDNSHSDNPADWVHPEDMARRLKELGLSFLMVSSRNHWLLKDGKTARPKFHVYLLLSAPLYDSDKFVRYCLWCIKTFNADPLVKNRAQKIFGYGDNPNVFVDSWSEGRCIDEVLNDDDLATVFPITGKKQNTPTTPKVSATKNGSNDFDWFVESGEWLAHIPDLETKGWVFFENNGVLYFQTPNGDHAPGVHDGNIRDGVAYIFSRAPAPFKENKGYTICQLFAGVLFGNTTKKGLAQFAKRYLSAVHSPVFNVTAESESSHVPLLDDFVHRLKWYPFQAKYDEPTQMEYIVQSVDELIRVAKVEKLDLAQKNGNFHVFNGQFWQRINKESFHTFLRSATTQFGVPRDLVRYHQFQEKLRKQFMDIANFPFVQDDRVNRINLKSGTLEFYEGAEPQLVSFNKRHGLCYQLGYDYNPDTDCPKYQAFLERCVPDRANQMILEEYAGYIFVKRLNFERVLFLFGDGANGKSVWIAALTALLGRANVTDYSLESITKKQEYRALLADGIANICTESADSLNIDVFKKIASGEPLECRGLYKDPITLTDYSRQIFATNKLPKTTEATKGFFRRFLIIPFDQYIPEEERNFRMNKVEFWEESGELSGILNMVIRGLLRLVQNEKFTHSPSSDARLEEYRYDSDSVLSFMRDEGFVQSMKDKVRLSELYSDYQQHCRDHEQYPVSDKNFSQRLRNLGYKVALGTGHVNYVFCTKQKGEPCTYPDLESTGFTKRNGVWCREFQRDESSG